MYQRTEDKRIDSFVSKYGIIVCHPVIIHAIKVFDVNVIITLYNANIYSVLRFGIVIWGFTHTVKAMLMVRDIIVIFHNEFTRNPFTSGLKFRVQ